MLSGRKQQKKEARQCQTVTAKDNGREKGDRKSVVLCQVGVPYFPWGVKISNACRRSFIIREEAAQEGLDFQCYIVSFLAK